MFARLSSFAKKKCFLFHTTVYLPPASEGGSFFVLFFSIAGSEYTSTTNGQNARSGTKPGRVDVTQVDSSWLKLTQVDFLITATNGHPCSPRLSRKYAWYFLLCLNIVIWNSSVYTAEKLYWNLLPTSKLAAGGFSVQLTRYFQVHFSCAKPVLCTFL